MDATAATEGLVRGNLDIRPAAHVAYADGRLLPLTARELALLAALARREGRVVAREELYSVVWQRPYRPCERSVDVYIARIRQKLDRAAPGWSYIHTHFGLGYRMDAEPAE